jgi:uncharacterized delta-60 repeat protein
MAVLWSMQASGAVLLDFSDDSDDRIKFLRIAPGDRVVTEVGFESGAPCGLLALGANGALDAAFDQDGRLSLETSCPPELRARPDGSLVTLESSEAGARERLVVRSAQGTVIATSPELYPLVDEIAIALPNLLAPQADGAYLVAGVYGGCRFCAEWTLGRFSAEGSADTTFGPNGDGLLISSADQLISSIHPLPGNKILVSGRMTASSKVMVIRLNSDGSTDASFGANGKLELAGDPGRSVLDTTGRLYLLTGPGSVARILTDGTLDPSYAGGSMRAGLAINSIAIDAMDRVLLFGSVGDQGYVSRFDTAGNLDATFNGTGEILTTFPQPLISTVAPESRCTGAIQSGNRPVLACSVAAQSDTTPRGNIGIVRFTSAGAPDPTFDDGAPDPDSYPDPISFPDVTAPYGTVAVQSAPSTISGFTDPARIEPNGAEYSIDCMGTFTATPGVLMRGQSICLRLDAPSQPGASTTAFARIGGRNAPFTVNAGNSPADFEPDAFAFSARTNVATGSQQTSNTVTVSGITGAATVTVANGSFSIGCNDTFTSDPRTIRPGQTICVRHVAAATAGATVSTTLTIGGVSAAFSSTTAASSGGGSGGGGGGGGGASDASTLVFLSALLLWLRRARFSVSVRNKSDVEQA